MRVAVKLGLMPEMIKKVVVSKVYVKTGQVVKKNQLMIDVEAVKYLVEIPSPFDGIVKSIVVKKGDTVYINDNLLFMKV